MRRTPLESRESRINDYEAHVKLVRLETPDLGQWDVYKWELYDNSSLVKHGSFPYGEEFITFQDVFDQLEFKYVSEPQMEVTYGPYTDADSGL